MSTLRMQRWYDMDLQLSELVGSLESLSEESQTLFAFLLTFFSDEIRRVKGHAFFRELEWSKLMGIYKSKSGRRWYDKTDVLQKAFNKLYSLNDNDKAAVARELYVPSQIVQRYEAHCKANDLRRDMEIVYDIVETSFREGANEAQERFSVFK